MQKRLLLLLQRLILGIAVMLRPQERDSRLLKRFHPILPSPETSTESCARSETLRPKPMEEKLLL